MRTELCLMQHTHRDQNMSEIKGAGPLGAAWACSSVEWALMHLLISSWRDDGSATIGPDSRCVRRRPHAVRRDVRVDVLWKWRIPHLIEVFACRQIIRPIRHQGQFGYKHSATEADCLLLGEKSPALTSSECQNKARAAALCLFITI